MTNKESIVGKNIICGNSGIGEIVDITSLHENGEEFYKVNFPKEKCINYVSISNQNDYRILASKEVINNAIKIFRSSYKQIEYSSTHERIQAQKERLKESDICKLAKTLSILNEEIEMHPQVNKSFQNTLKTFIGEVQFVLEVTQTEAYSILGIKAPAKK